MSEDNPTAEELLQIAVEVKRGDRPESDLARYGITLGPPITGDAAKEMLLAELELLDEEDGDPEGSST